MRLAVNSYAAVRATAEQMRGAAETIVARIPFSRSQPESLANPSFNPNQLHVPEVLPATSNHSKTWDKTLLPQFWAPNTVFSLGIIGAAKIAKTTHGVTPYPTKPRPKNKRRSEHTFVNPVGIKQ